MEDIRDWPEDDENLNFIVATEPRFQPHLRQLISSPLLNEGWRPSATNVEMVDPVSLNKVGCSCSSLTGISPHRQS